MENVLLQSGELEGTVNAIEELESEIEPLGVLDGDVCMPEKEEVVKLANAPKINEITLSAAAWVNENDKRHSQIVEVKDVTNKSQVDLTPDVQQLEVFYEKDVTFVTKNKSSVVTVYAVGQKPANDYTIQATLTDVDVPDGTEIWGVTVGTPISTEKLAEKLEEFSPLPTITENDNGKVLKAQGGKWAVQEDETSEALSNLEIEELLKNFT